MNSIRLSLMLICFFIVLSVSDCVEAAKSREPSLIAIEAETGMILYEKNADIVRPPASMIKLMQMLLVSEGLREGKWTLDQPITASRKAQHMGGTQVYLEAGDVFPLDHLMKAVSVASANDATMAVAEGLWGSEDAYKEAMNKRAQELGMKSSVFYSVHGYRLIGAKSSTKLPPVTWRCWLRPVPRSLKYWPGQHCENSNFVRVNSRNIPPISLCVGGTIWMG